MNGITFESECVAPGDPLDICDPAARDEPAAPETVSWDAYVLHTVYECGTFGWRGKDWAGIARRRLIADSERQLSAELWRGALARAEGYPNRFLASNDSDEVTSSAATPLNALACLEQYLAGCNAGQQGMIHATWQTVTHWIEARLVRREGQVFYTEFDTIVVPGVGYDGSGPTNPEGAGQGVPADASAGSVFAYATGIVEVRLSPITLRGTPENPVEVNRTTNEIGVIAERFALASWDLCCHGAAEIDLPLCTTGGVS